MNAVWGNFILFTLFTCIDSLSPFFSQFSDHIDQFFSDLCGAKVQVMDGYFLFRLSPDVAVNVNLLFV